MKIKLTVWGVCLITIISLTGCASFYEASISIARQYAEAVNSGKIEGGEYSSHVDAWANGGIGGQLLVGADAVVGMYEKISDNDYSGARELIKGSINNYVADPNMSSRGAKGSIISAGLGLGSSIIDDYSRNKIANNNEAFMEDHSKYMDPESPLYDPYFMDRLEYDDQGQIVASRFWRLYKKNS